DGATLSNLLLVRACSTSPRSSHARPPPSFPTRRSSDLEVLGGDAEHGGADTDARVKRNDLPVLERLPQAVDQVDFRADSPFRTRDRKSTRLNSSHRTTSYAVSCLKKKKKGVLAVRDSGA